MIQKNKRNQIFIFFSIIFLILFFIINKKNIFAFFDNVKTIQNLSLLLTNNKNKKEKLKK